MAAKHLKNRIHMPLRDFCSKSQSNIIPEESVLRIQEPEGGLAYHPAHFSTDLMHINSKTKIQT